LEPDLVATPISKVGDIFQLGPHRIACADAPDPEILHRLMAEGEVARLVLTDEPYNVRIVGNVTKGRHREFAMASGEMSEDQFQAFNEAWMKAVLPHLQDGGVLATFIDWRGYATANAAATKLGPHASQSHRMAEDQCRNGQPLPLAARTPAAIQKRDRLARQQYRAR